MKNKNIILLVFDGLRADKLSCLGYNKRDTTPFLNSIIDKCVVFNKHYTCAVRSLSAHISLVTGVHPHIHKACDDWSAYLEDFPTIFQIAQKKGYYTFGISTDNPFLRRETGFIRGFDKYIQIVKSNKQISNGPFLLKKIDEN
ncbi:MAG TPA: sulfatase-like hydrolase/transferase [bacterium]|nr:sulfatase-like hydrolase/transferase [bacterium]